MNKLKKIEGITLIALVITIIILLILAGISIAGLAGDNGLFGRVKEARQKSEISDIIERARTDILEEQAGNNGDIIDDKVNEIIAQYDKDKKIREDKEEKYIFTEKGYEIKVSDIWNGTTSSGGTGVVSVGEIFDETGEQEGKLHIGDFINYTAGDWTDGKISEIAKTGVEANESTNVPTKNFQFGGFTNESSRDGNATPCIPTYNYVKETKSDGSKQAVTGWRLFDVDDGKITLISAGCPEDFYQPSAKETYISEYILTGNVNSNADEDALGLGTIYKPRDWSMYVNSSYEGTATALSKAKLDAWYCKYMLPNADTYDDVTFRTVYGTLYETLIDNYSSYWLCSPYRYGTNMNYVNPDRKTLNATWNFYFGVRILISLSSDVKLSGTRSGTKTVTSRGSDYEYNVWDLVCEQENKRNIVLHKRKRRLANLRFHNNCIINVNKMI